VLREAFASAGAHLEAAKREARYLTFSDLEVHALRALESEEVRAYYAERWKAYLIDEVQDTNPDQARLMERLVGGAGLTIVGDEKQSIYGFRRADVRVFRELRRRIGREVELEVSYRTHRTLVEATNRTFQSLLESPQALRARRERAPHPGPHLRLLALESGSKDDAEACRRAEARRLATELKRMLDAGLEVWDKDADAYRPLRFDDIALLCRTGRPLELYGEALAEAGIPSVLSGGGNLFQTREALDAIAMLRVLAEPGDSLALAAVLRSPFFAVSDPVLFAFAQTVGPRSWWAALKEARPPELERAYTVLEQLMAQPRRERPSRLLQLADQLTGYTAVIANLPGAERREADWGGFLEFLRAFEAGTQDVFHVVRRLKRHLDSEVAIERPLLKARDAVTLMTIHKSKGLEWPVVAIVNLSGKGAPDVTRIRFAPELGCALRFEDAEGNALEPVLFQLLKARKKQLEDAEERRVYYVGLTRGRDQVILSAPAPKGAALEFLLPGLAEAGVAPELVPFDPVAAGPAVLAPPRPLELPSRVLLGPVAQGLAEIPVTALAVYHRCGEQFRFQYVERHPGLAEGGTLAAKVGTLTHKALETGVRDTETLARYAPELPLEKVKEALELAIAFDTSPAFDALRQGIQSREEAFRLRHKGLVLRGVIDAVGPDFVLDYKTDREMEPEHHNLQLWAYAKVKGVTSAYLAYLRHGEVVEVRDEHLLQVESLATKLAEGIKQAKYEAQPGAHCAFCGFKELCRAGTDGASRHTASLG
jgi:ATP-dependent helicase/nuclease subunit A